MKDLLETCNYNHNMHKSIKVVVWKNQKPETNQLCYKSDCKCCITVCGELFHAVVHFRLKAELASYNDIKRLLVGLRCSYCLLYHCRISFRNKALPYDLVLSLNINLWVGAVNEWWITPETVLPYPTQSNRSENTFFHHVYSSFCQGRSVFQARVFGINEAFRCSNATEFVC